MSYISSLRIVVVLLFLGSNLTAVNSAWSQESFVLKGLQIDLVAVSPCEKYIAASGTPNDPYTAVGMLMIWEKATRKEIFRHRMGPMSRISGVCFSPDGKHLATDGSDVDGYFVVIWDFINKKKVAVLRNDVMERSVTYSPDGKYLACTADAEGDGYEVLLWDTGKLENPVRLFKQNDFMHTVRFSNDSKYLACACRSRIVNGDDSVTTEGYIRVVDIANRNVSTTFRGFKEISGSIMFSSDDKLLAAINSGQGAPLQIIDFGGKRKTVTTLTTHNVFTLQAIFTSDSKWVVVGGSESAPGKKGENEGTVQIWNLDTKILYKKFKAHDFPVSNMFLARDNRTLITADVNNVKVWTLPAEWFTRQER